MSHTMLTSILVEDFKQIWMKSHPGKKIQPYHVSAWTKFWEKQTDDLRQLQYDTLVKLGRA